jgi:sugar lactone lactonase YvrE
MKTIIQTSFLLLVSCSAALAGSDHHWTPSDSTGQLVVSVEGFSGPEAVRYDAEQDLYFVSNFNGEVSGDANGFVSKMSPKGEILELEFMTGTDEYPFHAGRGMFIVDKTLYVADAEGIHGFNRLTGEHLQFVDLSAFEPGFPNDITQGPDGHIYVTDTGKSVIYRIADGKASIATETPFAANGITTNPKNGNLVIVPWSGALEFVEWDIDKQSFNTLGSTAGGGNYDGVEIYKGAIISACQVDTSLHVMIDGIDEKLVDLPGKPADIAIDTKRQNIAIPYVALHRVEIRSLK